MKAVVLADNIGDEHTEGEWGLKRQCFICGSPAGRTAIRNRTGDPADEYNI